MELNILTKNTKAFNNQDLNKLKSIHKDVIKRLGTKCKWLNDVIAENEKIFKSVKSLEAISIKEYYSDNTAICVLKIHINNEEIIDVVDIIEFDSEGKILSITAYKG